MQNRILVVIITSFCLLTSVRGQFGPTLSAGLTSLTGEKGDLDIELLSEIISQKQEELKKEILQRKVLQALEDQSFAFQNYVYSSLYAMLSFKDAKAIEKELLTQVSILSLQVGMAEAILQLSFKHGTPSQALSESIYSYTKARYQLEDLSQQEFLDSLSSRLKEEEFILLFSIDDIIDYIIQPGRKRDSKNKSGFSNFLVDAIYEAVRTNTKLEELGFVKIHPNLQSPYSKLSCYHSPREVSSSDSTNRELLLSFVRSALNLLVNNHMLFYDFINDNGFSIESLCALNTTDINKNEQWVREKIGEMLAYITKVQQGMKSLLHERSISMAAVEENTKTLTDIREGLQDYNSRTGNTSFNMNDYVFARNIVQPYMSKLVSLGILNADEVNTVDQFVHNIYTTLLHEIKDSLTNSQSITGMQMSGLYTIPIQEYGHLIRIITSLSRLDDAKSYEHIFNTLAQIGINSLGSTKYQYIKDIVYFLQSYTSIDRDSNQIHVEVEPLLLKLLTLYESKASMDFQLYFSTGLNQTFDINYANDRSQILDPQGEVLQSLSFASEKVGFKLKILNNERIQSSSRNELNSIQKLVHNNKYHRHEKSILSDVYVFGYGSGLLYNIANLTTAGNNFEYPMVGFGLGLAFYNSLDLSIWRSSPIVSGDSFSNSLNNRALWGFSFDIKLSEYLSALGEKRRLQKAKSP